MCPQQRPPGHTAVILPLRRHVTTEQARKIVGMVIAATAEIEAESARVTAETDSIALLTIVETSATSRIIRTPAVVTTTTAAAAIKTVIIEVEERTEMGGTRPGEMTAEAETSPETAPGTQRVTPIEAARDMLRGTKNETIEAETRAGTATDRAESPLRAIANVSRETESAEMMDMIRNGIANVAAQETVNHPKSINICFFRLNFL